MTVYDDVFETIGVVDTVKARSAQAIVDELVARGYSPLRAEVLAVFVPLGLARAVIARLPAKSPIQLSENAVVYDSDGGRSSLKLERVPEFQTALQFGEETFAKGLIPRDVFSSVISFSVELQLINEALDAGKDLSDSRMAPPQLMRLAGLPGFVDWYQTVMG